MQWDGNFNLRYLTHLGVNSFVGDQFLHNLLILFEFLVVCQGLRVLFIVYVFDFGGYFVVTNSNISIGVVSYRNKAFLGMKDTGLVEDVSVYQSVSHEVIIVIKWVFIQLSVITNQQYSSFLFTQFLLLTNVVRDVPRYFQTPFRVKYFSCICPHYLKAIPKLLSNTKCILLIKLSQVLLQFDPWQKSFPLSHPTISLKFQLHFYFLIYITLIYLYIFLIGSSQITVNIDVVLTLFPVVIVRTQTFILQFVYLPTILLFYLLPNQNLMSRQTFHLFTLQRDQYQKDQENQIDSLHFFIIYVSFKSIFILQLSEKIKVKIHNIKMQFPYQECYQKFYQSYGQFQYWPLPYAYYNWYSMLSQQYQTYYLPPQQYSHLYDWARQLQKSQAIKNKKPSRSQKRKIKKKQLQDQYIQEKALIGNWVERQRKDLVVGLQKIQEQQRKAKQKKQKKLSHLIQIHKQVYKHHLKRKTAVQNPNKRVDTKNRKKRISVIKKMKQIFQNKKSSTKNQTSSTDKELTSLIEQKSKKQQKISINKIKEEIEDEYQDISQDEGQQNLNQIGKLPTVSFPIKQIEYKNIGKLSGKIYNDIPMRQWVTNVPTPELEDIALRLINRLAYKQAIKKVNNPQKARKIIVSGLKECKRTLTTILQNKKSKCLIVALNIERNNLIKGVDDEIQKCITLGQQNKIPVIHTSTRSKLGRAFTGKFGPRLSVVSIINYEGYQDYIEELFLAWKKSCEEYQKLP